MSCSVQSVFLFLARVRNRQTRSFHAAGNEFVMWELAFVRNFQFANQFQWWRKSETRFSLCVGIKLKFKTICRLEISFEMSLSWDCILIEMGVCNRASLSLSLSPWRAYWHSPLDSPSINRSKQTTFGKLKIQTSIKMHTLTIHLYRPLQNE